MISKPKIAFVDDEPKVLSGLKRNLRSRAKEWDLSFHTDPLAALDLFREDPPTVVVLDIRMPGMSGIELAGALRLFAPQTVCIVLSGSTDFDVALSSINDANIFRYYVKPCATADLTDGIEEALSKRGRRDSDRPETTAPAPAAASPFLPSAALDLIHYGVVVTSPDGHALFTNAQAGQLLSDGDGISLDANGICRAARLEDTQRLHGAMAQARDTGDTTALTLETEIGSSLRVTVQPYESPDAAASTLVCLFLFSDATQSAPEPRLLQDMFGLTVSESRLAAALAQGMTMDEAAAECGVTKSSARTYLKNIFSKLGVSRQAELVRTILVSLATS